jgi:type IVB pilus formation R64 PilN family outer membrane protein
MLRKTSFLAAAICATFSGCSTYETRHGAKKDHEKVETTANEALVNQRSGMSGAIRGAVVTDLPYVDVRQVKSVPRYPEVFGQTITLTPLPGGSSLQKLAERVEAITGIPIVYQPELIVGGSLNSGPDVRISKPDSSNGKKDSEDLKGLDKLLGELPASSSKPLATGALVNYSGSVIGLYKAIASAVGASWEYDEPTESVRIYKYKQETFQIPMPEAVETGAKMASGNGTSTVGNLSQTSVDGSITNKPDAWKDIDAALKVLVSSEGRYAINTTTKMVVVRDLPERMESVREYLTDYADSVSKQVLLHVRVYRVRVNNTDQRSVNLSAAFSDLTSNLSWSSNNAALNENSGSVSFTVAKSDSKWAGSTATLNTLNQIGKTSVVQDTTLATVNNQATLLKVVSNTTYLAEMTQTSSSASDYSTSSELTPGTVESGLKCYFVPSVQRDGKRMLLTMLMSQSTLDSLDTYGTESASIQEPQTSARETQQLAWLKNGETYVLAGFQQNQSSDTSASPVDRFMWWMGGSSSVERDKEILVVTIRPTITSIRSSI